MINNHVEDTLSRRKDFYVSDVLYANTDSEVTSTSDVSENSDATEMQYPTSCDYIQNFEFNEFVCDPDVEDLIFDCLCNP